MSQANLTQSGSISGADLIDVFIEGALAALATNMAGASPPAATVFGGTIPQGAVWLDISDPTAPVLWAYDSAGSPGDWRRVAGGSGSRVVTAGESLAAGDYCYQDVFNARGSGPDCWWKIDADATAPVKVSPVRGFALAAIGSGSTGLMQTGRGVVTGLSGLTTGQMAWAHASTAGALTATEVPIPANGTQVAVVPAGVAINATALEFIPDKPVDFVGFQTALANGSNVTVEHWTDSGAREREPRAYYTQSSGGLVGNGTGTAIGDMTGGGGLAAAFNNNTAEAGASCALASPVSTCAVGKDWGSGNTSQIDHVLVYSSSDLGFVNGAANLTLNLVGNSANNVTNGTVLGTTGNISDSNGLSVNITASNTTGFRYHWVQLVGSGSLSLYVAEVQFYTVTTISRQEPVGPIVSDTLYASGAAITCKFSDAAGNNSDTKAKFTNRLGSALDLAFTIRMP